MENQNIKIANLKVLVSENCLEKEKNIIELYWKQKDLEFENTVKSLCESFKITYNQLNKLISYNSSLLLSSSCGTCNENYSKQVNSRKNSKLLSTEVALCYYALNKCDTCVKNEQDQINLQNIDKQKKLTQKLEKAIENKNWKNLSNFEKGILCNCFKMDFHQLKNHYRGKLSRDQFSLFYSSLEKIEEQDLLHLDRHPDYKNIINFFHLEQLQSYKEEIARKPVTKSEVEINHETNELKFKLTINENQYHPDSPLYAGTVTFKERIVIEPGVEYIFGQWQRANKNLYLTMIPLENLEKLPIQKRINSQPKFVQHVIKDYFNNKNEDF